MDGIRSTHGDVEKFILLLGSKPEGKFGMRDLR
jgi:hypothetical protein